MSSLRRAGETRNQALRRLEGKHHDKPPQSADDDFYDFDPHGDDEWCEHCQNTGELDCNCGGDLCVCDNGGTYPCPHCN